MEYPRRLTAVASVSECMKLTKQAGPEGPVRRHGAAGNDGRPWMRMAAAETTTVHSGSLTRNGSLPMDSTQSETPTPSTPVRRGLSEHLIAAEPMTQFARWMADALASDMPEPTAMVLSTITA